MYVIHGSCDAEMRVVEEQVCQSPTLPLGRLARYDIVVWYECPNCYAKVRKSEIDDGVVFAKGGMVVLNDTTVQVGTHRVTWHGGHNNTITVPDNSIYKVGDRIAIDKAKAALPDRAESYARGAKALNDGWSNRSDEPLAPPAGENE